MIMIPSLVLLIGKKYKGKNFSIDRILVKTRESSVRVNDIRRISFNLSIGVPQGGALSAFLFIIFIKGFLGKYETKYKYADGTSIV